MNLTHLEIQVVHVQLWLDDLCPQHFWTHGKHLNSLGLLKCEDQLVKIPVDHHWLEEVRRHELPVTLIIISKILDDLVSLDDALTKRCRIVVLLGRLLEQIIQLVFHNLDEQLSLLVDCAFTFLLDNFTLLSWQEQSHLCRQHDLQVFVFKIANLFALYFSLFDLELVVSPYLGDGWIE